jgi:hypothetical protein
MRRLFGIRFSVFALTLALPCLAFPPPGTLVLGEDPNSVSAGPNHSNRYVIYEVPQPGATPVVHMDLSWDFLERPVFWQNSAGITYFADVDRGYVKAASSLTPRTGTLAPQPAPIGASNVSALTRFGQSGVLVYDSVAQEAYSVELEAGKKSYRYQFAIPDYVFPPSTREVVDIDANISNLSTHTEHITAIYLTDLGIVRHEIIRDTSDPSHRPQILTESTKLFPTFKQTILLPMGGSLAVRRPLQMKRQGNQIWVMADAREDGTPIVVLICYRLDFSSAGRYSVDHVEDITGMQAPEMIGFSDFMGQPNLLIRDRDDVARLESSLFATNWTHNAIIAQKRVAIPAGVDVAYLQGLTQSKHSYFPKVQLPNLTQALSNYILPGSSQNAGIGPFAAMPWVVGSQNNQNPYGPQAAQVLSQLLGQSIPHQNSSAREIVVDAVSTRVVEAPEVILKRRAEFLVSLCWKRWRAGSGKVFQGLSENAEGEIGATAFAVFLNSMEADSIVAAYKTVESHNSDLRAMGIDPSYPYAAVNFSGKVDVSKLVELVALANPSTLPEDPNGDCDSMLVQ